ncbi:hypothetical protein HZI73_08000 [Vallitalea pronyensis]|uniref:Lambda-carrageenase n=1 Tax=Vallitalea pronyensis TaxID=1348613 RepID=A0A8J8SG52_9FIRM|nr:hypothetical protein [Vallitalea pronyensis]QUI22241.1 hypothetical protein HZI73_08000 [Vallitalea pronyensis]
MNNRTFKKLMAVVMIAMFAFSIMRMGQDHYVHGASPIITGFSTNHHIYHVKPATLTNGRGVIAASYDGKVLAYKSNGRHLWTGKTNGSFIFDLYVDDIDGDGFDESMAASADGSLYVFDKRGKLLWQHNTKAPLYCVNTIQADHNKKHILVGGIDRTIYKLSHDGAVLDTFESETGIIRHLETADMYGTGKEYLVAVTTVTDNSTTHALMLDVDTMQAEWTISLNAIKKDKYIGRMVLADINKDGQCEILLPHSRKVTPGQYIILNCHGDYIKSSTSSDEVVKRDYRMNFLSHIKMSSMGEEYILGLNQHQIIVNDLDGNLKAVYSGPASFAGGAFDPETNTYYMASETSGGDAIYAMRLDHNQWGEAFENMELTGRIKDVQRNIEKIDRQLESFVKPSYQDTISSGIHIALLDVPPELDEMTPNDAIQFADFSASWQEDYDRSGLSPYWQTHKDKRKTYDKSAEELIALAAEWEAKGQDFSMWAGHGSDPFYMQLSTLEGILKAAPNHCKMFIYSELSIKNEHMAYAINNQLVPLAELCQTYGSAKIFLRFKGTFWNGQYYDEAWAPLFDEKYKDVVIPSMEETNSRTQELSVAGRVGLWMTGAFDDWGGRLIEDNASYARQFEWSAQKTQSTYIRNLVYNLSLGATYFQNGLGTGRDQCELVYKLVDKGALIVPENDQILSIAPIALSMTTPDPDYIKHSINGHNMIGFDPNNTEKYVFDHIDPYWAGYPIAEHDISRYGYGASSRMLNFLPTTPYGFIPIISDNAGDHSYFDNKIVTDGKYFYNNLGEKQSPDAYKDTVQTMLSNAKDALPVVVEGDQVAWTVIRVDSKHVRVILLDAGYTTPRKREATITLQNLKGKKCQDILSGEELQIQNKEINVTIPAGVFRIIDITHK